MGPLMISFPIHDALSLSLFKIVKATTDKIGKKENSKHSSLQFSIKKHYQLKVGGSSF